MAITTGYKGTMGYLCVVYRDQTGSAWKRLFESCNSRDVYFRFTAAQKRFGQDAVAVVNRDGWSMVIKCLGRGPSTRYESIRSYDMFASTPNVPLIPDFVAGSQFAEQANEDAQ